MILEAELRHLLRVVQIAAVDHERARQGPWHDANARRAIKEHHGDEPSTRGPRVRSRAQPNDAKCRENGKPAEGQQITSQA